MKRTLLAGLLLCTSCSFVEFERGPYAIRDLEAVYSAQEDVTFFSWRLRKDARPALVSFELHDDGAWGPIDLADAPFAADPYECGEFWCYQYQVDGEYVVDEDIVSPLRSVHRDDGVFMGPTERYRRVQLTFDVDPIALGRNDAIDPRRFDWFADNRVPLVRNYEWQFSRWTGAGCENPLDGRWQRVDVPIAVERDWTANAVTDNGLCFNARPIRTDEDGAVRQARLMPSAETVWEVQEYVPPKKTAPIVWGMLLDLEIPSESRCRDVKDRIIGMVESSIAARGGSQKLGIFTPLDSETGEALSGCDQAATRDYPLEEMLRASETARAEHSPTEIRVLWVFVNNIELPPPERVIEQLALLGLLSSFGDGGFIDEFLPEEEQDEVLPDELADAPPVYTWAIGSNVFMGLIPWDATTPWRPVEDKTFAADIKSVVSGTLPFATMIHEYETEVEIRKPEAALERPLFFKTCNSTPVVLEAVGIEPGFPEYWPTDVIPWPEFDDNPPYYLVPLEPQVLVPRSNYVRRRVEVVIEVCTAFCEGPFRTQGGEDHPSWGSTSTCQWAR